MTCDTWYEVVSKRQNILALGGWKTCYFWAQKAPNPMIFVLLLCCWCGVPVVVWTVVVVVVLSRLCEDGALSRTQQPRCATVGVFVSLLWVIWVTCTADKYHPWYSIGSGDMWYVVRGSIQKSNNSSPEMLEELFFLGSESTKSDEFWPSLFLNQKISTISGPIVVEGSYEIARTCKVSYICTKFQKRFMYVSSLCAGPHKMTVALPRPTRPQTRPQP